MKMVIEMDFLAGTQMEHKGILYQRLKLEISRWNVEWSIDLGLCVAKFAANWRYVPTEPDRQMLDIGNMIESSIFTAHLPCLCQSMRPHARLRSAIPTDSVHIARLVQPFHTAHYKYTEGRPIEPDRCHDFTNTGPTFPLLRKNLYLALLLTRN